MHQFLIANSCNTAALCDHALCVSFNHNGRKAPLVFLIMYWYIQLYRRILAFK